MESVLRQNAFNKKASFAVKAETFRDFIKSKSQIHKIKNNQFTEINILD